MPDTATNVSPEELLTIAASRAIRDGAVCFVGIGLPSAAANLALRTHAPKAVLIYESGVIGARPDVLPLSIGDGELTAGASAIVSVPEMFTYWLQGGRIDIGFLGAAQIDRFGNLNTTVIGPYDRPVARLPGAGGAPEIATSAKETIVVMPHSARTFVEQLDFITTVGHARGRGTREWLGLRSKGPTRIITSLGMLEPDAETRELVLTGIHEGVLVDDVVRATGWPLRVSAAIATMPLPSDGELSVLRDLQARTAAAHAG